MRLFHQNFNQKDVSDLQNELKEKSVAFSYQTCKKRLYRKSDTALNVLNVC